MKKYYFNHPILKNLIQFVAINGFEPDGDNYIPVVPDGMSALVVNIGKPYERSDSDNCNATIVSGSHFVGIKSRSCFVRPNNGMKTISIRFRPGALPFFLRTDLGALTDSTVDATLLFGQEIRMLEEQFFENDHPDFVLSMIEEFLLNRFRLNTAYFEVLDKVKTIYRNPAYCSMDDLRMENSSYKKLQLEFRKNVGITPKLFLDIIKFNYSASLLHSRTDLSFTEIGYKAEYYDQAHFIRSFTRKSGYTPGKFLRQNSAMFLDNLQILSNEFSR